MDEEEWSVVQEQARSFVGSINLYAVNELNELFLVTWDFTLWRWDEVDGCFMPTEKLT